VQSFYEYVIENVIQEIILLAKKKILRMLRRNRGVSDQTLCTSLLAEVAKNIQPGGCKELRKN